MNYGSVCSGIEAATVAWSPLGWSADWLAEIEAFPSAVLAHHYPEVPNLGDMTTIAAKVLTGAVAAPDVLVGGTPCQAFSVAGMRQGLADARGQLTIKYVELADAIDFVRLRAGKPESIAVWENVPGVLSDKQNAFGCFLGALAGEDSELQPSGEKWTNAGCVYGPKRAIAWRVLDAQYFGVAQRRRRVFVVASAREDFDPAAVLFEREGVRRDTAPSRGETEDVAGTLDAGIGRRRGSGMNPNMLGAVPVLEPGKQHGVAVCPTLRAGGNTTGGHRPPGTDVDTADSLIMSQGTGFAATGAGYWREGIGPLRSESGSAQYDQVVTVTGDVTHTLNTANNGKGCSEDGTGRGVPTIAFTAKDYGGDASENLAPTLRAGGHNSSHANSGNWPAVTCVHGTQDPIVSAEHAHALGRNNGQENAVFSGHLAVRRLTPVECERLQGFPDDYTNVPYRNKIAADGPRYKAIGNSMAVPVMYWIGQRIQEQAA